MTPEAQAETCYDCGHDLADCGRVLRTCLWKSPATGAEHWAEFGICPACARRRDWWDGAKLSVLAALAAVVAFVAAYQLLP
jgi:hypothetical protein